jgi:surface polysaccharide O-acyltransferase-like enzyme
MNKERYDYIDLLKVIAICMVLILHSEFLHYDFIMTGNLASYIQFGIRILYCGVPLFVMVNGFLLLPKKFDLKNHIKKMIKIFLIFLFWAAILIVSNSLLYGDKINISYIVNNILLTTSGYRYTGILWFLQYLLSLYLIFPLIKYVYDKNKNLFIYLFIIVFILTFTPNILFLLNDLIKCDLFLNAISFFNNTFQIFSKNLFIFYFMLGGLLYELKLSIIPYKKKILLCGIISYIISLLYGISNSLINNRVISGSFNCETVFMIPIIISIFILCMNYKNKGSFINKIIKSVGMNTMGIYLIHIIVINVINKINLISNHNIIFRGVNTFVVLTLSYLMSLIISKIPYLKKIIKI